MNQRAIHPGYQANLTHSSCPFHVFELSDPPRAKQISLVIHRNENWYISLRAITPWSHNSGLYTWREFAGQGTDNVVSDRGASGGRPRFCRVGPFVSGHGGGLCCFYSGGLSACGRCGAGSFCRGISRIAFTARTGRFRGVVSHPPLQTLRPFDAPEAVPHHWLKCGDGSGLPAALPARDPMISVARTGTALSSRVVGW